MRLLFPLDEPCASETKANRTRSQPFAMKSNFVLADVLRRGYSQLRDGKNAGKPRDSESCPMI
jgi:hypothetical protein